MRFLKNKIRLAQEALQRKQQKAFIRPLKAPSQDVSRSEEENPTQRPCASYSEHLWASTFTKPDKNIIINYGKAIFSFAMSDLAKQYIGRYFQNEALNIASFNDFVAELKPRIAGYKNFEAVFTVSETDSEEIALYRRVLKMLGVVFMKYYSVSWIINGKITHKLVYLKNRYSIMRRITKEPIFLF